MRCDEVVRELSAPTAGRDRAAMGEHLAACSACAEWARRIRGLDRLWEATGPAEPTPEAWDAVWANIAQALPCPVAARRDHEDSPAPDLSPSRNGSGPKVLVHPASAPAPVPAVAGVGPRGRSWRLAAVALVGLAQAAAILVALGLAWRTPGRPEGPPEARPQLAGNTAPAPIRVASPVKVDLDVPEGHLILIRSEETRALMVDATPPEMNTSSDFGLFILNVMESAATPQVAAR